VSENGDLALIERCRRGDREALLEIVERYQRPVFNAAYRIVGNREDAADIAQTTFLKVFEHLERYDAGYKLFSWVYRIAVNESIDHLKHNGRQQPFEDDGEAESANPEILAEDGELSRRVQASLMELPEDYRVVLALRHFSECSYEAIAEILHLPEKTVKSRLYTARQLLRDCLERRGVYL